MPLTHQDNWVSMGGSLKEVSILKNCYISADPKGRLNSYEFSHPFEPPIEACTSFYVEVLAQKDTRLGRLLDPGW
jgi:hypothetical protein